MARHYLQGRFRPKNPSKYAGNLNDIVYRSSWELKFLRWCDLNPSVIQYSSEEVVVPYYSTADDKWRRYFVDFVIRVKTKDGDIKTHLIEIKPESQTKPPRLSKKKKPGTAMRELYDWQVNQDKWKAADEFAKKHGFDFQILTEKDLF